MKKYLYKQKHKGITLLVLLIATSLSVVVISTIYSTFRTGLFGYKDIEDTIAAYQSAATILEHIDLDLRNAYAYSKDKTLFSGSSDTIRFLTLIDSFKKDSQEHQCAHVSYELNDNRMMRVSKEAKEALKEKSEVKAQEMADDVKTLHFAYGYRLKQNDPIRFDKDFWDDQAKLPLAVRVNISIHKKTSADFQRTIFLPAAANE